jgi:hypothetical protein
MRFAYIKKRIIPDAKGLVNLEIETNRGHGGLWFIGF